MVNENMCPVCGFGMEDPHCHYNICPSCGTEFGVSDANSSVVSLRTVWVETGARWWSTTEPAPDKWNAATQLASILARESKVTQLDISGVVRIDIGSVVASSTQEPVAA